MNPSVSPNQRRFLYNNDASFILGNALHGGRPLTVENVRDYVDLLANVTLLQADLCLQCLEKKLIL